MLKKLYGLIFNRVFAWSLITFGFLLIILPLIVNYFFNSPHYSQTNTIKVVKIISDIKNTLSGEPIKIDSELLKKSNPVQVPERIIIPSLNINLKIVEAKIVKGYWEISETTASHGVGSASPGENGNVVIFAHARNGLFGPLKNIKKNTRIYIMTHDRWFEYEVSDTKMVLPTQIETIKPTDSETLTLFTCSGFLDTKRLIVTAKPTI